MFSKLKFSSKLNWNLKPSGLRQQSFMPLKETWGLEEVDNCGGGGAGRGEFMSHERETTRP